MERQENSGEGAGAEKAPDASVTKTAIVLYLAFFAVWCAGAAIGEAWPGEDRPAAWGMPLWFVVGCLASFAGVAVALVHCVRGWLK